MSLNNVASTDTIPPWMKQAQRGVDWGALLIIGFCLLAGWNFITEAELPAVSDHEAYVYRTADYAQAFENGIFYMRWSPDVLNGYGAPIPHFYPSGATYIAGLMTYLFTNDAVLAIRILYVILFIFAGSTTYTLITQRTNAVSGLIGAIVYTLNPFVTYTIPHQNGDLSLMMAVTLLPASLWAINRLLSRNQPIDVFLLSLLIAALIVTYPAMLLQVGLATLLLSLLHGYNTRNWSAIKPILLSVLIGFGMSAFYWMPAIQQLPVSSWIPHPINDTAPILNWADLLSPVRPVDAALVRSLPIIQLGWGIIVLVMTSALAMLLVGRRLHAPQVFLITGLSGLILAVTICPTQIEWVAFMMLCLSIGTSYLGQLARNRPLVNALVGIIAISVIVVSIAPQWKLPATVVPVANPEDVSAINYEQLGYGIAGVPYGNPIPSHLSLEFALNRPMQDPTSSRLPTSNLSATLLETDFYSSNYVINTTTGGEFIYQRAYFEGWVARLDTQELPTRPTDDNLVSVTIPPVMNGTLTIGIGSTLSWNITWGISAIALVLAILYWVFRWRNLLIDQDISNILTKQQAICFLFLLISLLGLRFTVHNLSFDNAYVQKQPLYTLQESAVFVRNRVGDSVSLLAFSISDEDYRPNQTVDYTAYWQILSDIAQPHLVRIRLTDTNQSNILVTPYEYIGDFPIHRLPGNTIMPQVMQLQLPPEIPDGRYLIFMDVVACELPCMPALESMFENPTTIRLLSSITIVD